MPRVRKTLNEWLERRLEILLQHTDSLETIDEEIYNPAKSWTCLKLIGLTLFASIYSNIIPKVYRYRNWYYLDLFSGSGLCKLEETGDIIIGSAIATPNSFHTPPTKIFIMDLDIEKLNALMERVNYLKTQGIERFKILNYVPLCGDCNTVIYEALDEIDKNHGHYLAFVDPYGMQIKKRTMDELLKRNGDIILTFQSFLMANKVMSRAKNERSYAERMDIFCGGDYWRTCNSADELLEAYIKNVIKPHRELQLCYSIQGRRKEAYNYDWILAVKETRGGSPWLEPMKKYKSKIERLTGTDIKNSLDVIKGRSSGLKQWQN